MLKRNTTKSLIERFKEVHGDLYDYSKVEYIDVKTPVTIICKTHGEFYQRYDSHLSGRGCSKCGLSCAVKKRNKNRKKELEKTILQRKNHFIKNSNSIHNSFYNYDLVDYVNSSTKVTIVCPLHGEFSQTPASHKAGTGCPICGLIKVKKEHERQRLSQEEFIEKAKKIHGEKYDYRNVEYINSNTKVEVICPVHGAWMTKPSNHLTGKGCRKCVNFSCFSIGFTKARFVKKCNDRALLYFVRLENAVESFVKFGISSSITEQRFFQFSPYKVVDVLTFTGDPENIWNAENKIHRFLNSVKYTPIDKFNGYTECFIDDYYCLYINVLQLASDEFNLKEIKL